MLKTHQRQLLLEIVSQRYPELTDHIVSNDLRDLSSADLEVIRDELGLEFAASGLREDWEPNPRGLEIEDLIDFVNNILFARE